MQSDEEILENLDIALNMTTNEFGLRITGEIPSQTSKRFLFTFPAAIPSEVHEQTKDGKLQYGPIDYHELQEKKL